MSDNAEFLSNWRTTNGGSPTEASGLGSSIAGRAKSLFSSAADALQDGYEQAYNVLPMTNQDTQQSEPSWFQMSRFERMMAFFLFLLGSIACFALGFFLFPVLTLKPRKFAMLWTLGSLLFVLSFGCLQGPQDYCRHLVSKERLPFTAIFFGSVIGTLYCAAILKSTILTLMMGIVEIFAVLYYTVSYFPFGAQGLSLVTNFGARQVGGMVGL
ncbi:DEKNAAC101093 [Brettanomyces naardenensis]|uniref:Protein transport protein SFT2 n=1 Tax=Brettanomyces naardenensis TaxID=13370 RepID=A0A448YHL8_BRENA|nr:DEKNAAC101093 [Brettanomyces naardenensis]